MKNVLLVLLISFFSLGSGNCNGDDKITGKYRSIIFVQPSASDYPVNLHEEGGYVEFNLKEDFTFEAEFFIPDLPEHQLPRDEVSYKGTYSFNKDTIRISGTSSFLDNETFILKENKIEMKNRLRRGPMDIVLEKVED